MRYVIQPIYPNNQTKGKPVTEVFVGEVLQQYREDPYHFKLPEGESEHEVEQRMVRFIET